MEQIKGSFPDCLFEVSWEVCNKIGGIHTVLATKAVLAEGQLKKDYITVGPDVWMDTEQNPEFSEDKALFRSWRQKASEEGLNVRVGRWNISGSPIAILVDFTPFISRKDEILTAMWKRFGVDSLTGNWDYIEAALFGYAAGMVIESFIKFNLNPHNKVVAHFHEWMTGAGLLYIKDKDLPVATVFTTHATVLGRCIAGNNLPLYKSMDNFNPDEKAREFGVLASHSLEKHSAANADVFTTVSWITARECARFLGKEPDVITPNGFLKELVPSDGELESIRKKSRARMLAVASAMCAEAIPDDALIIGTGGRYEFKNKGIDIFIDALAKIDASAYAGKRICAFFMIPSGNKGADKNLLSVLGGKQSGYATVTTHYLMDKENDIITRTMRERGLFNSAQNKVKVFFVPSYLNGNDGIFDMPYYDLLAGMDLTVFPSYYEPWGYTPLESLAFHVPSLTTTLAGFGLWVRDHYEGDRPGLAIVDRNDDNYDEVVECTVARILQAADLSQQERQAYRDNAVEVSRIALWDSNMQFYWKAYSASIESLIKSKGEYPEISAGAPVVLEKVEVNRPVWSSIMINSHLPDRLSPLEKLSRNLWWCWNDSAKELFESIDPELWSLSKRNPLAMLDMVRMGRYVELSEDKRFLERMDGVYAEFSAYMEQKTERKGPSIAYFCMEYGLDSSLKIYSGGLGILAGDYLKESSDMNVDMVAVGLLYRYGYFTQKLSASGDQVSTYDAQDFTKIPASPVRDSDGNWVIISVAFPGRNLYARLWKVEVGRTDLYLLDTDFEDNRKDDRAITHQLYGGDWENRLKQEILLGIGGITALRRMGIHADVYHCNEGHAAFTGLERIREYVEQSNLIFTEALEVVRATSLFTTHTPVPAGHDSFSEDMLRTYLAHYASRLRIGWPALMGLGRFNPSDNNEKFSMSVFAANLSQEINGVSWMHGKVSRKIFAGMWPGYLPEELHISYVTNGVHYATWTAPEWKEIHASVFGSSFASHHYDKSCFNGIYDVDDKVVWDTRNTLRKRLIDYIKDKLSDPKASSHYSPRQIVTIQNTLRADILTIGFARRFATYKRAHLLFSNLDRLDDIVNNPQRPVQFIFAGKAHPADKAGQDLIKKIVDISKMPQFIGKIVFVPDYDISLAKLMVQGVDVWMNNPTRPLEASGTSGEKAAMNGVMHFSVLDGWWIEGYKEGAGWALPMERTYDDQNYQDELDAATIYNMLEADIVPLYYDKDKSGLSAGWIRYIKNTVAMVACNFTTNRMLGDYLEKYYMPLSSRGARLKADDFRIAKEIADWKRRMKRDWKNVEALSFVRFDSSHHSVFLGENIHSEVTLGIGDISPDEIGVEIIVATADLHGNIRIEVKYEMEPVEYKDGIAKYAVEIVPDRSGQFSIAGRFYAKHPELPHRQDFDLVRWL